jgi:hypothetical protein
MPLATQIRILELSSSCRTVRKLAVFHDDKWSTPAKGHFYFPFICIPERAYHLYSESATVVQQLNEIRPPGSEEWTLFRAIKTNMYSSGESKTAWVFRR